MAKKKNSEYKKRTAIFGSDAEAYVASLFKMYNNPNGTRRPDLLTRMGDFEPKLSLEVKSGKDGKGVMTEYQLHYAITAWNDYAEILGEEVDLRKELFDSYEFGNPNAEKVAFYYDVVSRVDGIRTEELDKKFSSVRFLWGDQHIVPHEYAFAAFAAARAIRTGEDAHKVAEELKRIMVQDALYQDEIDYDHRKDTQQWQNLNGKDIVSVFYRDPSLTTRGGPKRVEVISEIYPEVNELERVLIQGPNGTSIYVLSHPEHHELFDRYLRGVVEERLPVIEKISKERQRAALRVLGKIKIEDDPELFPNMAKEKTNGHKIVSESEYKKYEEKMKRLMNWLARGESPNGFYDDVPF